MELKFKGYENPIEHPEDERDVLFAAVDNVMYVDVTDTNPSGESMQICLSTEQIEFLIPFLQTWLKQNQPKSSFFLPLERTKVKPDH